MMRGNQIAHADLASIKTVISKSGLTVVNNQIESVMTNDRISLLDISVRLYKFKHNFNIIEYSVFLVK